MKCLLRSLVVAVVIGCTSGVAVADPPKKLLETKVGDWIVTDYVTGSLHTIEMTAYPAMDLESHAYLSLQCFSSNTNSGRVQIRNLVFYKKSGGRVAVLRKFGEGKPASEWWTLTLDNVLKAPYLPIDFVNELRGHSTFTIENIKGDAYGKKRKFEFPVERAPEAFARMMEICKKRIGY